MPTSTKPTSASSTIKYDGSIGTLLRDAQNDWGNHEENKKNLIYYQIGPEFDAAVWGINLKESELIAIQAPKKQRKSTLLANLVLNFAKQLLEKGYWEAIYSLEAGMDIKAYRDVLVSMFATKIMVSKVYGTDRTKWPDVKTIIAQKDLCNELGRTELCLSKKFLRYGKRSKFQQEAIDAALKVMPNMPISIFGPSAQTGSSRNLDKLIDGWEKLYLGTFPGLEGKEHRVFGLDHIQLISGFAGNPYQLLQSVTPRISDFIVTHPGAIGIVLSQVSLTSQRAEAAGQGEMEAAGGGKLGEEANSVFTTRYDSENDPYHLEISTPFSRYEQPPRVMADIEPSSGVFLRPASPVGRK